MMVMKKLPKYNKGDKVRYLQLHEADCGNAEVEVKDGVVEYVINNRRKNLHEAPSTIYYINGCFVAADDVFTTPEIAQGIANRFNEFLKQL